MHSSKLTAIRARRAAALSATAVSLTLAACGGDSSNGHAGHDTSTTDVATPVKQTDERTEVNRAFVRQMIYHHAMAIDMAAIAQAGTVEHPEVRTLAKEIVDVQTDEIGQLNKANDRLGFEPILLETDAIGDGGHPAGHDDHFASDATTLGLTVEQMGMSMDMQALRDADPVDEVFVRDMIVHHEGAIAMSQAQISRGSDAELIKLAKEIVTAQRAEVAQMRSWQKDWR